MISTCLAQYQFQFKIIFYINISIFKNLILYFNFCLGFNFMTSTVQDVRDFSSFVFYPLSFIYGGM